MKPLLAAILLLAIAIALMCVGIIVKGKFPETEVSRNENMRRMGIKCAKEEEMEMLRKGRKGKDGKSCSGNYSDACIGCGLYKG